MMHSEESQSYSTFRSAPSTTECSGSIKNVQIIAPLSSTRRRHDERRDPESPLREKSEDDRRCRGRQRSRSVHYAAHCAAEFAAHVHRHRPGWADHQFQEEKEIARQMTAVHAL